MSELFAEAALSGDSSVSATAEVTVEAIADLVGASELATAVDVETFAAVAATADSALTDGSIVETSGAVTLESESSTTVLGTREVVATADLVADSTLLADVITGYAEMISDSALSADAVRETVGLINLLAEAAFGPTAQTVTRGVALNVHMLTAPITPRRANPSMIYPTSRWDVPLQQSSKNVSGIVYDTTGAPIAGATAKLVRQADDQVVAVMLTSPTGVYFFSRDENDTFEYYVIGYTDALTPQIHGTSDRGVVPS